MYMFSVRYGVLMGPLRPSHFGLQDEIVQSWEGAKVQRCNSEDDCIQQVSIDFIELDAGTVLPWGLPNNFFYVIGT